MNERKKKSLVQEKTTFVINHLTASGLLLIYKAPSAFKSDLFMRITQYLKLMWFYWIRALFHCFLKKNTACFRSHTVCERMCVCVCVCDGMCVSACEYVCMCVHVWWCVWVHVYVCACVYVSVCVCVYVFLMHSEINSKYTSSPKDLQMLLALFRTSLSNDGLNQIKLNRIKPL